MHTTPVDNCPVFQDGETVCFLGDSITHTGHYHRFAYDYYLTRFPERTIRFVNAGIAGDWAGGTRERLTEDVTDKKPTSVAIMFGMNDVNRGSYVSGPDAQQKAAQQDALDGYRKNMETLVNRLRNEVNEPRLFFMSPSPFDQTVVNNDNNNQPGCNDGLERCTKIVRDLATKNNGTVVDFHGPMTAFNQERQKADPTYTITGPDRVHPGAAGHLMMAWLFLRTQGAPALVSKVVFEAASGQVTESANATVSRLMINNGTWEFTVLEKALPFPVNNDATEMLTQLPIEQELNQEIVSFKGLAAGKYELLIDGTLVGRYSADDLSKGINLAFNTATPQYQQAQTVAQLNGVRHSNEVALRNYAAARWFLRQSQVNPDDLAAVGVFTETKMNKTGYFEDMVLYYLKTWPERGLYVTKIIDLENKLFATRQPVAHTSILRLSQSH